MPTNIIWHLAFWSVRFPFIWSPSEISFLNWPSVPHCTAMSSGDDKRGQTLGLHYDVRATSGQCHSNFMRRQGPEVEIVTLYSYKWCNLQWLLRILWHIHVYTSHLAPTPFDGNPSTTDMLFEAYKYILGNAILWYQMSDHCHVGS